MAKPRLFPRFSIIKQEAAHEADSAGLLRPAPSEISLCVRKADKYTVRSRFIGTLDENVGNK